MPRPIIAVTDSVFPSLDPAKAALAGLDPEFRMAASASAADILAVGADADAVLVTFARLTAEVIGQLRRCRAIGRFGIGVDNLDIPAATAKGIAITYVPDYCVPEVSDHAMALLLALARKLIRSNALVHGGRWELPAIAPLHRLEGRTLGLVGFGKIPQAVVPKARAFGLEVIVYDPYVAAEAVAALGAAKVEFDRLLAAADYVSVHAPLTPETKGLFGAEAFRRMKPNALLVNTARGPLVDDQALAAALDAGQLAGAALDVLPTEPPAADNPLLGRDNVILTPHTAFYSVEALEELQTKCASDVARVLRGERPVYPVNPQVLA